MLKESKRLDAQSMHSLRHVNSYEMFTQLARFAGNWPEINDRQIRIPLYAKQMRPNNVDSKQ